jgi:allantoinase
VPKRGRQGVFGPGVLKLAAEARADPAREATTVVIGIHPFVVGTPDGAAALRRVLTRLKADDAVWLTDTDAIMKAAGVKTAP